jgi:hypothetical protein
MPERNFRPDLLDRCRRTSSLPCQRYRNAQGHRDVLAIISGGMAAELA